MAEDEHTEGRQVTAAVQIRLSPYWPEDPQIWFAQVKAQFATCEINSQQTKFDYIVSSLTLKLLQRFATSFYSLPMPPLMTNSRSG